MKFASARLKYLYFSTKLASIALIGAAMTYIAHFVFMRMLGGTADIVTLSICAGAVSGALLIAAAICAVLYCVQKRRTSPKPSVAVAEALLCVRTSVPLAAGKDVEEIAKVGDANGVFCLQVTLLQATALQFVALVSRLELTATAWVSLALAVLLAVTLVAGWVKRSKEEPYDADALARKLAALREARPPREKGAKRVSGARSEDGERAGMSDDAPESAAEDANAEN